MRLEKQFRLYITPIITLILLLTGCGEQKATEAESKKVAGDHAESGPTTVSYDSIPGGRPNVIFIFADDLGWGDLACYGHPYAKTPNLDLLASQGTRFERFYVTGVTCSPSRTGIMTSQHPASFHKYPDPYGFADKTTVTDILHKAGYTTGHFGKWHIGSKLSKNQVQKGTYGIDEIQIIRKNDESPEGRDVDVFNEAIRFIQHHANRPFYVNIWTHISHHAVDPPRALVEQIEPFEMDREDFGVHMQEKFDHVERLGGNLKVSMSNYLADIYSLDLQVGKLMQQIEALGLSENTLVIFSSDHGPSKVFNKKYDPDLVGSNSGVNTRHNMMGYSGGLRGEKHDQYEGGIRTPFIVRWPNRIPAGKVNGASIVSGLDYLPTLCALLRIDIHEADFQGENMSDVWLGMDRARKSPLFWKTSDQKSPVSMLAGKWKIHEIKDTDDHVLYDLSKDEFELEDVSAANPEVVKQMASDINTWKKTLPKEYIK